MNSQDLQKAVVLMLLIAVIGIGVLGYVFFYLPYQESADNIERLAKDLQSKRDQIAAINKDKPKLERWRQLSLPGEVTIPVKGNQAGLVQDNQYFDLENQYKSYLNDLLRKHKIDHDYPQRSRSEVRVAAGPQQQTGPPPFTTLAFEVKNISTKLPNLVAWMIDFQNTPLLQRIKRISIKKVDATKSDLLKVDLTIEAIIVQGATKRAKTMLGVDERLVALNTIGNLRGAPGGLALVPWAVGPTGPKALPALKDQKPTRDYTAIAKKNIFVGMIPYATKPTVEVVKDKKEKERDPSKELARPTKDVLRFPRLTDISGDETLMEANLWDPLTKRVIRLRDQKGYDRFPLLLNSNDSTVIFGKVVRFEGTRGLIFRIQLAAQEPSKSSSSPYPDPNAFYHPTKKDLDELLKAEKVKMEDADRVFKVHRKYWDTLLRDKVMIRKSYSSGVLGNIVSKKDLIRGKVLDADAKYVVLRLEERYGAYRDDAQDVAISPHLGFCMLTGRLSDALQNPVSETVARQLLASMPPLTTAVMEEEDPEP